MCVHVMYAVYELLPAYLSSFVETWPKFTGPSHKYLQSRNRKFLFNQSVLHTYSLLIWLPVTIVLNAQISSHLGRPC
jgi:hypothetical protein